MIRIVFVFLVLFFPIFLNADDIVSKELIKKSYKEAQSWFLRSLNDKGVFNYLYDAHLDSFSTKNNAIRQLMASRLLAELASKDRKFLELHQKNLNFIFKHWIVKKDNTSFVYLYDKSKLGSNAMFLRTLTVSPFFNKYKIEAERVKNAILKGVNKDGSMNPFLVEPNYRYSKDYLLTFYSGEALVALIEYYEKVKDKKLLEVIKKSQNFYIEKYAKNLTENYYPAYVPWHTISLNKLYKITKNKQYSNAIFILNDKLLELQDRHMHVGRFFNPETPQYGNPHSSSDGVYTEGLSYALEIAMLLNDEYHTNVYKEAVEIGFSYLRSLQYTKENSIHLPSNEKVIGAFRIRRTKPDAPFSEREGSNIRIDSTQHIMDAMNKYLSL